MDIRQDQFEIDDHVVWTDEVYEKHIHLFKTLGYGPFQIIRIQALSNRGPRDERGAGGELASDQAMSGHTQRVWITGYAEGISGRLFEPIVDRPMFTLAGRNRARQRATELNKEQFAKRIEQLS